MRKADEERGTRMAKEDILAFVKKVINEEIEKAGYRVVDLILFGSRARGEETPDSDWDFYVFIDRDIEFPVKRKLVASITTRLSKNKIPADILIQPASVIKERQNDPGYLAYYVLREGQHI
ncbi:DNA polymerase, beta domain protein region [Brevinematales bacterium NS]|nr:DNA polymerase, beta domain protein region [Brevinematales bacterium NS]